MTAHVAEIWRYPIKSCGRERLVRTFLTKHQTLPWDRRWAIAHEASKFDEANPEWVPCANFARAAKAPGMQAISSRCDTDRGTVTLSHPRLPDITIDPDEDGAALVQWIMPLSPPDRALPTRVVRNGLRGMTDTRFPSISLINRASHGEVAAQIGRNISPNRWRANLLLDGLEPWEERGWIGKRIRVGQAELEVRKHITRCMATAASTRTGERDADTLKALSDGWGHQEFGINAEVVKSGTLSTGDSIEMLS